MSKKYFWIKLKKDFFQSKEMKLLRRIAGGDTYTIIYLKMLLAAADCGGVLKYESLCDSIAEEIALEIDEELENVEVTLSFLRAKGIIEINEEGDCFLPETLSMTGSETATAERMRKSRERKKLQEQEKDEKPALKCNNVTPLLQPCYTEIDKEIEIDKDLEIDGWIDIETKKQIHPSIIIDLWNANPVKNKISASIVRSYEKDLKRLSKEFTYEDFRKAILKIAESKYLPETITFDWFLQKDNFKNVLIGRYDEFIFKEIQEG